MSKETRQARRRRIFDAVRKTPPEPLAPPDSHQEADVAAMLREIGIALVEVEQPTQLVQARLSEIAAQYTTQPVRIVVLPTVLLIQLGTEGYEVDTTTTYSLQLDMADRIDDIATLASVGAINPALPPPPAVTVPIGASIGEPTDSPKWRTTNGSAASST